MRVNYIDHVAIRVKDHERSAKWYQEVWVFSEYSTTKLDPHLRF